MKKGFTLIELLAVIVILAIIALIATPIVLNIINDTKESATLRSVEHYLDGVEQSIMKKSMETGQAYKPNLCVIQKNGDLLCDSKDTLVVEVKGEKPNSGKIYFEEGKIGNILITLGNDTISKNEKNELVHFENKYEIGQEITFNPGDGDRKWNVIDEDGTTVTLMNVRNFIDSIAWYNGGDDNNYGPITVLNYLNTLTTSWTNVDPIKNYSYINNISGTHKPYGYQKIEIKDGKTRLTHKDGKIITEVEGTTKARLLSIEEIFEIGSKININLTQENLRSYIERNLDAINAALDTSFTTVDSVIDKLVNEITLEDPFFDNYTISVLYESKYLQTYFTVLSIANTYKIEPTYDILLPDYMHSYIYNPTISSFPSAYWTLSSKANDMYDAWTINYDGLISPCYIECDTDNCSTIYIVITVSKSKL